MSAIRRIRRGLTRIEAGIAAFSLALMLLTSLVQILARNFFDTGFSHADTLSRHLVLYVTFLGAVLATEYHRHIHIELLDPLYRPATRARLQRIFHALSALLCAALGWAAGRFWIDEWHYTMPAERWAVALAIILPVGFALLSLHFALHAIDPGQPQREDRGS